jgi:Ca-activated chloride channel family protein
MTSQIFWVTRGKIARASVCALFCVGVVGPAAVKVTNAKPQVLHVQTNLVSILTSVLDANGRPVVDLPEESFQIFEEGVQQKIERFEAETNQPLDLALMVDASLSTLKDLKFEGESAAHFIRQVVRPGDRLSVFSFADAVDELAGFSSDVPTLQNAARKITPGAGTVLYDALVLGSKALERLPAANRRRVIVLVTDAGETTSVSRFEDARREAIASNALLYSIVIRPIPNESGRNTAGEHALITITDSTGGALFYLDNFDQLETMFERIDRELRTQYLLGYYPQPVPPAGVYRHVEVKVKGGGTLHYKREYLTVRGAK